jgi:hypothetical protein
MSEVAAAIPDAPAPTIMTLTSLILIKVLLLEEFTILIKTLITFH